MSRNSERAEHGLRKSPLRRRSDAPATIDVARQEPGARGGGTAYESAVDAAALSALFDQPVVGIARVSLRDGARFQTGNASFREMLGYSDQDLRERTIVDVIRPEDREAFAAQFKQLLEGSGSAFVTESRYVRRNGRSMWGRAFVSLVRDRSGRPDFALALLIDVTREKEAEETQRRFTNLLWTTHALLITSEQLAGASGVRDIMKNLADGALSVSDAVGSYVELVDARREEVEVIATHGQATPPEGYRRPYRGSLTDEIVTQGKPAFLSRIHHEALPSQSECLALMVPLFADEEVRGTVVLLRRGEAGAFEQTVIDRVRTLSGLASLALDRAQLMEQSERRRREAENAVRARDEILAIVSHDLRNPLGTMLMSASLLRDVPLTEEDRRKQYRIISRTGQRMNRLIRDLLDVSQIEAGRLHLDCRWHDPASLVKDACAEFVGVVHGKRLLLACDVAADLHRVCADADRVIQALSNYIGNAVKFTPAGGRITVRAAASPAGALFSVTNTGPGIPAEHLPHVFDRYWRAKATARLGAGLGLAIVKGIVDAHGGRAWAESEPGRSTTFYLMLANNEHCAGT